MEKAERLMGLLVTGATGFLGRAVVTLALERGYDRICIYSRDEHKQARMRAAIEDAKEHLRWFIGDVRDRERLMRALAGVHTVIHCAALKRVEVGEYNPGEMVKTNVLGTMNVIEAAIDAGVQSVVLASTDKACEPSNAYGASKLMAEKLILAANNWVARGPRFSVVRLGNLAGSRGSVIENWRSGGRIVTNPGATRFWMTARQAADRLLGPLGTFDVPDLTAYSVGDLWCAMGITEKPEVIGLGAGEKLHERMLEGGPTSAEVRRMSVDELQIALETL